MTHRMHRNVLLLSTSILVAGLAGYSSGALAADQTYQFDIPAESLGQALTDYSRVSSQQIVFSEDAVGGKKTVGLHGRYSGTDALNALLAGTDLRVETGTNGVMMVRPKNVQAASNEGAANEESSNAETVTVTGTRIRGAQPTSPVVTIDQDQMRMAGQANLGEAIRDMPQSFNGGQNPGVALGAGASSNIANQNGDGASSINLRGLGPDATLTLLNGRRLPYDAIFQATDISEIPLAAVDRVEILLDGASAIYGSDAVAGVANVILKRDFEGVQLSGGYGAATDGGDNQTLLNGIAGMVWDSGGFLVTGDLQNNTAVNSDQRDFTRYMPAHNDLYPWIKQTSELFTGHQDLGNSAEFTLDAMYSNRSSNESMNYGGYYGSSATRATTYWISPTLRVNLPGSWTSMLNGSIGQDNAKFNQPYFLNGGVPIAQPIGCYCNRASSVEIDGEGPVFQLPGGDARASVGAGYRKVGFTFDVTDVVAGGTSKTNGERSSYYTFGELNLPLVSPEQAISFINELTLNGAVRYENYSDFGSVTTPKVGASWAPTQDFEIKANWGKTFKAPILNEEYSSPAIFFDLASSDGDASAPADATALTLYGGNRNLQPERANTFALSAVLHPTWLQGFNAEVGYFSIDYTDRVQQPITNTGIELADPLYAQFVTPSPTLAQQQAAINRVPPGSFYNDIGTPYDPSKVVALVNDLFANIAEQSVDGIDFSASYNFALSGGTFTVADNGTWLEGWQKVTAGSAQLATIGAVFNPPHFRSRSTLSWSKQGLTLSSYVNYIGGLDNVLVPDTRVSSETTLDLDIDYKLHGSTAVGDVDFNLSVQNLFDQAPPYIAPIPSYYPDYDSTNYSALGRFIKFTITKSW